MRRSVMVPRSAWLAAIVVAVASLPASAGSISLAWDPVSHPGLAGYRVYYGPSSGNYTGSVTLGPVTQHTLTGLSDCSTWHVAVKAFDVSGSESSAFSNPISGWSRPVVTQATPSVAMQGNQVTIDISGTNFQSGASVEIANPNVRLANVIRQSCSAIQLLATVEPTASGVRAAEVGTFDVTVLNPGRVFGTRTDGFEVAVNPRRFDLDSRDAITRNRVDGRDVVWLARVFGARDGDAQFNPDTDVNGDGWIDGDDLAYLGGVLGQCWSGSAWSANACPTAP